MISPSSSPSRSSSSERTQNQGSGASSNIPHITETRPAYALLSGTGGASSSGQPILDEAGEETSIFSGRPGDKGKQKSQTSNSVDDPKEKASQVVYSKSERRKLTLATYRKSEKGKIARENYRKSEKGKAVEAARRPKRLATQLIYKEKNRAIADWAKKNGWPNFRVTMLTNPKRYQDGTALAANVRAAYEAAHSSSPVMSISPAEPSSNFSASPSQASGVIASGQSAGAASASQSTVAGNFDGIFDIENIPSYHLSDSSPRKASMPQTEFSSSISPSNTSEAVTSSQPAGVASTSQSDITATFNDLFDVDVESLPEISLANEDWKEFFPDEGDDGGIS